MYSNRKSTQQSPTKSIHTHQQATDYPININNKAFYCQKHQEIITNFSTLELKPLCPECISEIFQNDVVDDHSVDSLKNVKINCSKKIKSGVYELNRQLESSEIKYLLNPQSIIDEGIQEIQKCKKQILRTVDFHFEQLFIQFKSQVQDNVLKASDLTFVFENIKQSIIELDQLSSNLESGNTIQSIIKICQLDLKSLIDKFKSDIHKIVDSRDLDPIKIITNNNAVNEIKRILPQVAVINKIHSHYHNHSPPAEKSQNQFQNSHNQSTSPNKNDNRHVPANPNNAQQQENHAREQQLLSQQIQQLGQQERRQPSQTQIPQLLIRNKDYFNQQSKNKFLVSIQERVLQGVDLNLSSTGKVIGNFEIYLPEDLPADHSLLVTQNGDIFVTGGIYRNSNKLSNDVKRIVLSSDRKNCQIDTVAHLNQPRYAHSTIQIQDRIFVIGGFSAKGEAMNEVEAIHFKDNKFGVDVCRESLHKSAFPTLAIIKDQYIVKIGGIDESNNLCSTVETYNIHNGNWENIDPTVDDHTIDQFNIFYGSGCVAINNDELFIYGGSDEQNQYQNLSFVLSFKTREVSIKNIMKYPLPQSLKFTNVQSVIQDNLVYFKSPFTKKSLICFNGQQWLEIQ